MRVVVGLALLALLVAGCTGPPRAPWEPHRPDDSPCGPAWPKVNFSLVAFPHAWPREVLLVDHPQAFQAMTLCVANDAVAYLHHADHQDFRPHVGPRTYDELRILDHERIRRVALDLPVLADGELILDLLANANTTGAPVVRWNGTVVASEVVEAWAPLAFADARISATWPREHLPQNLSFSVASPWNLGAVVDVERREWTGGPRVEGAELHLRVRGPTSATVAEDHDGVTFDDTPRPHWDGNLGVRTGPLAVGRHTIEVTADEGFGAMPLEVRLVFRH